MANDGVVERAWELRLFLTCPRHCRLLVNACPSCLRGLSWFRWAPGLCACGADLTRARGQPVTEPVLLQLHERLLGLSRGKPTGTEPTLASLHVATELLGFLVAHRREGRPGGKDWRAIQLTKTFAADVVEDVAAVAPVLLDWLSGFHLWLDDRRREDPERMTLKGDFGPVFRRMAQVLPRAEFGFLHDEVRRYLASSWSGDRLKRNSPLAPKPGDDRDLLGRAGAARLLGLHWRSVDALIRAGSLRAHLRRAGTRTAFLIERGAVAEIAVRAAASLDNAGAGRLLGLTWHQVRRLRRAGLLRATTLPDARGQLALRFEETAVVELAMRLESVAGAAAADGPVVPLAAFAASRSDSTVALLRAVLASRKPLLVRVSGDAGCPPFLRLGLPREIALAMRARHRQGAAADTTGGDDLLPVHEAARLLGARTGVVAALARTGHLGGAHDNHRLADRAVTRASVEAFRHDYRLTGHLAAESGRRARKTYEDLVSLGLQPVALGVAGQPYQCAWAVADLVAVGVELGGSSRQASQVWPRPP